jgi:hypothetical protein
MTRADPHRATSIKASPGDESARVRKGLLVFESVAAGAIGADRNCRSGRLASRGS